jgi:5-methylcytosine-specific restriction endonuclease McrA
MKRALRALGLEHILVPHPDRLVGVEPKTLMRLQDRGCYLCGDFMVHPGHPALAQSPLARTRDHVVPRCRGGGNRRNVLLAHDRCNGEKGERLPYPCELIYLAAVNARLDAEG